eukprot:717002-Rhodomonas_salina.2
MPRRLGFWRVGAIFAQICLDSVSELLSLASVSLTEVPCLHIPAALDQRFLHPSNRDALRLLPSKLL